MITYRNGMPIFTSEGKQVGRVADLVLTPDANKVTHLVVGRGFLFTEEKVMPETWISHSDGDKLVLNTDQTKFDSLPNFRERDYVRAPAGTLEAVGNQDDPMPDILADPTQYYPDVPRSVPMRGALIGLNGPLYVGRETRNIPEDATVLDIGGRVLAKDGQHVGQLEQLVTNDEGQITHFVLSEGLLFKTHKRIPAQWIDHVEHQDIYLAVVADALTTLPDYNQT